MTEVLRIPDVLLRDIPGFENYQISEYGDVYNKKTGLELKKILIDTPNNGYYTVNLFNNGKRKSIRIHKILAEIFIENPYNKPLVDHINRIRTDNRLENLRWVDRSENGINRNQNKNNTSGYKGICKLSTSYKTYWRAEIVKNYKKLAVYFPYTEEGLKNAIEWRKQKELELHQIV